MALDKLGLVKLSCPYFFNSIMITIEPLYHHNYVVLRNQFSKFVIVFGKILRMQRDLMQNKDPRLRIQICSKWRIQEHGGIHTKDTTSTDKPSR